MDRSKGSSGSVLALGYRIPIDDNSVSKWALDWGSACTHSAHPAYPQMSLMLWKLIHCAPLNTYIYVKYKIWLNKPLRIYSRRPKWQMRAWQTAAILSDMARRVNAADTLMTGPPLPEECFQYLNVIDNIEKFSNAPNLLDQSLWQILCKMRRIKIEVEFKVNLATLCYNWIDRISAVANLNV